ncbi:cysteinyl leukotriene receptor 1-like [Carcharodon carcharias]|uniref:cysteinyl leukotriene receptor 1-like n=1 Tax=Carcharodon carcharias TaxID=13397 RepID=UPI001B7E0DE1|nr:cysteinyl leukotriene receptor 1-like [Carcharodon carcharias]
MNNTSNVENNSSCESIYNFKASIYVPSYIIIFIFGFTENLFCLYVFLKLYKKKTAFSIVMVNLAISDLLFVCTLPWRVHYYSENIWKHSHSLCIFLTYALYLNMYCSIYFLTLISILRYFAIVHPITCLKFRSVKCVQIICIAIWMFVGIAAIPFLSLENKKKRCFEFNDSTAVIFTMNLFSLVLGFIIPFFIFNTCYILVIKTLLTSEANHHNQKSSRSKAIVRIIVVMVIFITGFPVYHVLRTVYLAEIQNKSNPVQVSCFVQKSAVVTLCQVVMNPCLDPVFYYFAAESFRDKLRSTVKNTFKGCPALMHQN